jgi:hypothetical protein
VWACSLVLTALLAANLFGSMEMLRIFWDKTVALNPAADARDERHMPLSREGELDTLWRAPASDVAEEALTIQTRFSSFDDYWLPLLEKQGPAGDYVATLTVGEREQLRLRLRKRLLGDGPDGPIVLSGRAWVVRGIVPRRVASMPSVSVRRTTATRPRRRGVAGGTGVLIS